MYFHGFFIGNPELRLDGSAPRIIRSALSSGKLWNQVFASHAFRCCCRHLKCAHLDLTCTLLSAGVGWGDGDSDQVAARARVPAITKALLTRSQSGSLNGPALHTRIHCQCHRNYFSLKQASASFHLSSEIHLLCRWPLVCPHREGDTQGHAERLATGPSKHKNLPSLAGRRQHMVLNTVRGQPVVTTGWLVAAPTDHLLKVTCCLTCCSSIE